MIVTQKGVVDITPEYNRALRPIFCVSEGDKTSRQIVLTVMQSGEAFLIPFGSTVYIVGKKPDNNVFTYRCSYSGSDVTFSITEQMSAASGIVLCELQINLGGEVLGSANFVYWTEPTPLENGSYSESDLNIFLEAIAGAERLDNFYAGIENMVAQAVEQIQIMPGQVVIDPTLLINGAAADAKATGDIVRAFMNALITETTAEAIIATCDDAAGGLPLKKLTANIVPAQAGSGDPSPDNVRAISGYTGVTVTRTGKNILQQSRDTTTFNGVTAIKNDDGSWTLNGTCTTSGDITLYYGGGYILKPGTYTLSGCPSGGSATSYMFRIRYNENGSNVYPMDNGDGITFTVGYNATVTRAYIEIKAGYTYNNLKFYPQLEVGSVATEYEAPQIATYSITFPTAAGTVYGGTLTVNGDGSGTLTVDGIGLDMGTANWSYSSGNSAFAFKPTPEMKQNGRLLCSCYKSATTIAGAPDKSCGALYYNWIAVKDSSYADAAAFKTGVAGQTIVYPLAAPTTYALSAVQVVQMLNGVNNVWTDAAGTLTTEYYASTDLYVEKRVNAQRNMIAGVEEAMIATKNYSVNDLLIVGNTLYKVTAAISSGAALVVGTNIAQTTVAEQLIALANA